LLPQAKELEERRDRSEKFGAAPPAQTPAQAQPEIDERDLPDFRDMSIVPLPHELLGERDPYLRKNEVHKPWTSGAIYLDTHFRLSREDFVDVSNPSIPPPPQRKAT